MDHAEKLILAALSFNIGFALYNIVVAVHLRRVERALIARAIRNGVRAGRLHEMGKFIVDQDDIAPSQLTH